MYYYALCICFRSRPNAPLRSDDRDSKIHISDMYMSQNSANIRSEAELEENIAHFSKYRYFIDTNHYIKLERCKQLIRVLESILSLLFSNESFYFISFFLRYLTLKTAVEI